MTSEERAPAPGGERNTRRAVDRFWSFLEGGFLERLYTPRRITWIVAIALFFIVQVYNRFTGLRKIRLISDQKELIHDLKVTELNIKTRLTSERRLSTIEDRVREEELKIAIPKTPPIVIER